METTQPSATSIALDIRVKITELNALIKKASELSLKVNIIQQFDPASNLKSNNGNPPLSVVITQDL